VAKEKTEGLIVDGAVTGELTGKAVGVIVLAETMFKHIPDSMREDVRIEIDDLAFYWGKK